MLLPPPDGEVSAAAAAGKVDSDMQALMGEEVEVVDLRTSCTGCLGRIEEGDEGHILSPSLSLYSRRKKEFFHHSPRNVVQIDAVGRRKSGVCGAPEKYDESREKRGRKKRDGPFIIGGKIVQSEDCAHHVSLAVVFGTEKNGTRPSVAGTCIFFFPCLHI